jgi:hypothetical protein
MITKHQTLQAVIALAIALPAQAGYGFALAISPEIRLQPGSHVHLPARLTNTGTLDIAFGPGSGAFSGQFNDLTLRPGEHFDFAYLNIPADADAPLGAISHQYPLLGIAFPDGANLMAAGYTQPAQPGYRTRVIIDHDAYARPLSLAREAQDGYFSGSTPAQVHVVLTSYTELAYADVTLGAHPQAVNLPILAVPEPQTWLLFGMGVLGVLAAASKRTPRGQARHLDRATAGRQYLHCTLRLDAAGRMTP